MDHLEGEECTNISRDGATDMSNYRRHKGAHKIMGCCVQIANTRLKP
jgi:hypothetical protein